MRQDRIPVILSVLIKVAAELGLSLTSQYLYPLEICLRPIGGRPMKYIVVLTTTVQSELLHAQVQSYKE